MGRGEDDPRTPKESVKQYLSIGRHHISAVAAVANSMLKQQLNEMLLPKYP